MNGLLFAGVGAATLLGIPLFVAVLLFTLVSFSAHAELNLTSENIIIAFQKLSEETGGDAVAAILLFTVAGFVLAGSGAPKRIVRLAEALLGWVHGGLAIVTVVTLAFFTTFTGASGITIIALGGLLFPLLLARGYPKDFSLGVITASGSIGLLFFPSLPVFYCATIFALNKSPEVTPDKLFVAALIPGMLMVGLVILYSYWVGRKHKLERTKFTFKEVLVAFRGAFFEATLPFWLLYAVVSGTFGFNDIALLTASYIIIVEVFIYRDVHPFKDLPNLVFNAAAVAGAIVIILMAVQASNEIMTQQQVPQKMVLWLREHVGDNQLLLLIGLNLLLLVVGCLMDIFSALACVLPLLVPLAQPIVMTNPETGVIIEYAALIDPFHLAVIFMANLELGYITPPVGMNLFISGLHFRQPILKVAKAVLPFLFIMLISVLAITYIKPLTSWLPSVVYGESLGEQLKPPAEVVEGVVISNVYMPPGETTCVFVLQHKESGKELQMKLKEGGAKEPQWSVTGPPEDTPAAAQTALSNARTVVEELVSGTPNTELLHVCEDLAGQQELKKEDAQLDYEEGHGVLVALGETKATGKLRVERGEDEDTEEKGVIIYLEGVKDLAPATYKVSLREGGQCGTDASGLGPVWNPTGATDTEEIKGNLEDFEVEEDDDELEGEFFVGAAVLATGGESADKTIIGRVLLLTRASEDDAVPGENIACIEIKAGEAP
jgi:tripartite ATP-independent transporter DctM subunit